MSNGRGWKPYAIAASSLTLLVAAGLLIFLIWRPTVVLVVRHAERSDTATCTPDSTVKTRPNLALLPAGVTRREVLRHVAGEDSISAIFASEFCRTQNTVGPLAADLGLAVTVVDQFEADGITVNVEDLVSQIKSNHKGKVVLIAGHSDTIPPIIEKLGAGTITAIGNDEFDNLYVVIIPRWFGSTRVVRLKYGAVT